MFDERRILRSASPFFERSSTAPPLIMDDVERYNDVFGVEPICTTLTSADAPIAPEYLLCRSDVTARPRRRSEMRT
jgi:hypothetical protein